MRAVAKKVIETAAIAAGAARLGRRVRRRVAILAYHNVVAAGDEGRGDASLHLRLDRFLAQIDRLARTHQIVALDALKNGSNSAGRPLAVITFDDAYEGAVTLALPELERRRIPATMFVAPGLLGTPATWWDDLAEGGLLSTASRERALNEEQGRSDRIRDRWRHEPLPLPRSYRIASLKDLRAACVGPITVGSHSWGHEYLPSLGEAELRVSLVRAREWLAESGLPACNWLALPYGGSSELVERCALEIGHEGVLRVEGGAWDPTQQSSVLPRINVPAGMSVAGVELRASGLV